MASWQAGAVENGGRAALTLIRTPSGWEWRSGGVALAVRQGVAYQPTEGSRHIYHDYIARHRLDRLTARLLTPDQVERVRKSQSGFEGEGASHGLALSQLGFTLLRLYSAPLEDPREVACFKASLHEAYKAYGLRVYLSDDLGLYDPVHSLDRAWLTARLRRLVSTYGREEWLAALSLGNENERYIRGGDSGAVKIALGPEEYYGMMDALARDARAAFTRLGTSRPLFLGHGHPQDVAWPHLEALSGFDGLGLNLYTSVAGLKNVLREAEAGNRRRVQKGQAPLALMIAEFGQNAGRVRHMSQPERAEDFQSQLQVFNGSPSVTAHIAFEAVDEAWKSREEGPGANQFGILGKPPIEQVFQKAGRVRPRTS